MNHEHKAEDFLELIKEFQKVVKNKKHITDPVELNAIDRLLDLLNKLEEFAVKNHLLTGHHGMSLAEVFYQARLLPEAQTVKKFLEKNRHIPVVQEVSSLLATAALEIENLRQDP